MVSLRPLGRSHLAGYELDHAFVGEKPELVEGDSFYNFLKKGQGEADGFLKIKRREAATEKPGSAFGSSL